MKPQELDDFLHRNKMTGNDLAAKLGVHWTTISRWRNGHEPIPKTVELALKWIEAEGRINRGAEEINGNSQQQKARWVKKEQARSMKLSAWVCEKLDDSLA